MEAHVFNRSCEGLQSKGGFYYQHFERRQQKLKEFIQTNGDIPDVQILQIERGIIEGIELQSKM